MKNYAQCNQLLRVSEANELPITAVMQVALTIFKRLKMIMEIYLHFHDHLKTSWIVQNNEPDSDALRRLIFWKLKFWHNLHSSLQFVLSKLGIDIFDSLEIMRF